MVTPAHNVEKVRYANRRESERAGVEDLEEGRKVPTKPTAGTNGISITPGVLVRTASPVETPVIAHQR